MHPHGHYLDQYTDTIAFWLLKCTVFQNGLAKLSLDISSPEPVSAFNLAETLTGRSGKSITREKLKQFT